MHKAIRTRYIPSSQRLGRRISATDHDGNRVMMSLERIDEILEAKKVPAQDQDTERHRVALQALCDKMKWKGTYSAGMFSSGVYGGELYWVRTDMTI